MGSRDDYHDLDTGKEGPRETPALQGPGWLPGAESCFFSIIPTFSPAVAVARALRTTDYLSDTQQIPFSIRRSNRAVGRPLGQDRRRDPSVSCFGRRPSDLFRTSTFFFLLDAPLPLYAGVSSSSLARGGDRGGCARAGVGRAVD